MTHTSISSETLTAFRSELAEKYRLERELELGDILAERVDRVQVHRGGVGRQARQVERDGRVVVHAHDLRAPLGGREGRRGREVHCVVVVTVVVCV